MKPCRWAQGSSSASSVKSSTLELVFEVEDDDNDDDDEEDEEEEHEEDDDEDDDEEEELVSPRSSKPL